MTTHHYSIALAWEGSTGVGYREYIRAHDLRVGDELLTLSADSAFLGDPSLPNPSSCFSRQRVRASCFRSSRSQPAGAST